LCSSGRDGNLLLGCPSFSYSAQGVWTRGGRGVVRSVFFCMPLVAAIVLASGGDGGVMGVGTGIYIEIPSV
jgi:hypothetical protein